MNKQNEKRDRGMRRYRVNSDRTSALYVIPFNDLKYAQHDIRIVDMSIVGAGIASREPIQEGLACFEERVSGHKLGVVAWSRRYGVEYRAGISFVGLPVEKEDYILHAVRSSSPRPLLHDPDRIIGSILASIRDSLSEGR